MAELKPCPFCGGEASVGFTDGEYCVFCSDCESRLIIMRTAWIRREEDAIAAWNQRAAIESTLEREEELQHAARLRRKAKDDLAKAKRIDRGHHCRFRVALEGLCQSADAILSSQPGRSE